MIESNSTPVLPAPLRESLRHQSEEIPNAHGRLKDLRTGPEAHALYGIPHRSNHHGRCEMGVGGGSPRRGVFIRGEECAEFRSGLLPVVGRVGVERAGHGTPTDIAGEGGLLRVAGLAPSGLNGFEDADGGEVIAGLGMEATLPDPVRGCYSEVAGGVFFRFSGFGVEFGSQRRSAVGRYAHSCVAISQAAW